MSGPGPVGPENARVAVVTGADEALRERLLAAPAAAGLLIGPLHDHLHSVELLAESLLERPNLRYLIAVRPHEGLRALFRGESRWPNLTAPQAAAVRAQVEYLEAAEEGLWPLVERCQARWPGPAQALLAAGGPFPAYEAVPDATTCFDLPDPVGYIIVGLAGGRVTATHYSPQGQITRRFAGRDSAAVALALSEAGLLGRIDHALYIGRELMKAEVAQRLGLPYVQDEPLQLT